MQAVAKEKSTYLEAFESAPAASARWLADLNRRGIERLKPVASPVPVKRPGERPTCARSRSTISRWPRGRAPRQRS